MKILFFAGTPRQFRTTLIGYFYSLCNEKNAEVILLKDDNNDLDKETKNALTRKDLFPNLVAVVPSSCYKNYIAEAIVVPSDMHSFVEMEMLRWAKKKGMQTMAIQATLYDKAKTVSDYIDWENSKRMLMPLVKIRKYLGHFWMYVVKPLIRKEKPFWGKSSFILHKGQSGMRDADYQVVWDEWQRDILLTDGVSEEKLRIENHPIKSHFKIFDEAYFQYLKKETKKSVLLVIPSEFVTDGKHYELWGKTIDFFYANNWQVFLKPHPDTTNFLFPYSQFAIDSEEPIDKYIYLSDLVIGLPPALSTSLYIADLMGKKTIAYDPFKEWRGDFLKGRGNIIYINNESDLTKYGY